MRNTVCSFEPLICTTFKCFFTIFVTFKSNMKNVAMLVTPTKDGGRIGVDGRQSNQCSSEISLKFGYYEFTFIVFDEQFGTGKVG
jgi:hypothetical protein